MAALTKPCLMILVCSLTIIKGWCQSCGVNNITVGTVSTGRLVEGKDEWNVEVINNCPCPQSHIVLRCKGFESVEPVDPSVFVREGDVCLLIRGLPLAPHQSVKFSYAAYPPYFLIPDSSTPKGC